MEQCSQMQQFWLRQQRELVKKTHTLDEQTESINALQKEELILSQKRLRLDGIIIHNVHVHVHIQVLRYTTCMYMYTCKCIIYDHK